MQFVIGSIGVSFSVWLARRAGVEKWKKCYWNVFEHRRLAKYNISYLDYIMVWAMLYTWITFFGHFQATYFLLISMLSMKWIEKRATQQQKTQTNVNRFNRQSAPFAINKHHQIECYTGEFGLALPDARRYFFSVAIPSSCLTIYINFHSFTFTRNWFGVAVAFCWACVRGVSHSNAFLLGEF